MFDNSKYFPLITAVLGTICLLWIIYDIVSIYTDLHSVVFLGRAGVIIGIGYIFILLYHFFIVIIYFLNLNNPTKTHFKIGIPIFGVISFLALVMEKVMYDEVGREFYIEYPMPGETHFIVFGLLINSIFLLFSTFYIYNEILSVSN